MSAAGNAAVDRAAQFKTRGDTAGAHIDIFHQPVGKCLVAHAPGAESFDHHTHRVCKADRIGKFDLATLGQFRGHDVLGKIARHIGARAVDLTRILARKRSAAVRSTAAVSVNNYLAAGKSAVARGAADDKAPRRIDEILRALIKQLFRQHREDHLL